MKKITLFFFFFVLIVSAQENLQELATGYIDSQENFSTEISQEKFFMHTNKSLYFSGEKIWYKVYVVSDIDNTPNYQTTNLHVNVYNSKKELVESSLVFVENGKVNGFIDLDRSYETGTYYIALSTVYSSNFNSKYVKQLEVVNLKESQPDFREANLVTEKIIQEDAAANLEVTFFPESNVFLNRAYNTMYFKATFNGNPIQIEGSIINVNFNSEVKKVSTNKEGLGAVTFPYYPDKKYALKTIINGKLYLKPLPIAVDKGFVIHYDDKNTSSKEVAFTVSTNNETNKDYEDGEIIYAVINRKGALKSVTPIILESKFNSYALKIEKEGLFDGVNTLTIFNYKNEQIANRNFFFNKNKEVLLSVEKGKETKDSIQLKIKTLNKYIKTSSSISVLTEETKMYNNNSNARTDFLLSPYVELHTIDPNWILNTSSSLQEKDMVLQINAKFKKESPLIKSQKLVVKAENGLSIKGVVNTKFKNLNGFKVLLTSKENNIVLFEKLEGKKTFAFNNLLLLYPSVYKLALLNPSGVIQDATFDISPITTSFKTENVLKYEAKKTESVYYKVKNTYDSAIFLDNGVEQLGEVSIIGKKRKKRKITSLDSIGYVNAPKELGNGFSETLKRDPFLCKGCTIFEYLDQIPNIRTSLAFDDLGLLVYDVVFTSRGRNTFFGSNQALVILDGFPLANDLSTLNDLRVDDVEFIKINRSGAGYGIRGASGVIDIKLKKIGDRSSGVTNVLTTTSQTNFGFKRNTASFQYMPLQFSSSRAKMYYDTVDWIPEFTIMPNKDNFIMVAKEGNESLKIIINGLNEEGDLLYKEVNVNSRTIN
mgnify:CR=1 FL=1